MNTSALLLAADADNRLYFQPNVGFSGTITNAITFRAWDGTNGSDGATGVSTTSNGGTTAFSSIIDTADITINANNTAPSVSVSHQLSSSGQKSTFTVHATDASGIQGIELFDSINGATPVLIYTFTAAELQQGAAANGNYQHVFIDGDAPFALINNNTHQISARAVDNATNAATAVDSVTFNTNGGSGGSTKFSAPAGVAGEPINLGLTDPTGHHGEVTVTVTGAPSDWILNGGSHNLDGSWTVTTTDVTSLTVTTPDTYAGARVLTVTETWADIDGTTRSTIIANNIEAYAPGSPIFAWSGDDHLTGSSGHDLFVFSQPIGHDLVYDFNLAADQIDLISYASLTSFGDIQAHMVEDAAGNAVITLGEGQSITLQGIHANSLTASNFVFDLEPVTTNDGSMVVSDGAMLPLSGTINNTGTISLNSTGGVTELEIIEHGIKLQGGGQLVLSDDSENVVTGTNGNVTLTNVDNTISGAGHLGNGQMTLVNEGTIIATGTNALDVDTGTNVVANTGTLEATGNGGLVIHGDVANSGLLWANGGNVTVAGAVNGSGSAVIDGVATLEFGAASSMQTTFGQDATGTLFVDNSLDFTGIVSGFGQDDHLDLSDIKFGAGVTHDYLANAEGAGRYADGQRRRAYRKHQSARPVHRGRVRER